MRRMATALLDVPAEGTPEAHVAAAWQAMSDTDRAFFADLVRAGTYGTVDGKAQKKLGELQADGGPITKATKRRYWRRRFFPGLDWFKDNKPFFYRHRWGIPFFWVYRLVRGLFTSRKAFRAEMESVKKTR